MREIEKAYGDRVACLIVYVREAHPEGSKRPMPVPGKGVIDEPKTDADRQSRAGDCVKGLGLDRYLAVVDGINDVVSVTWGAWPDRLAVIGRDGTVVFHGEPGPRGFDPDLAEKALKAELAKPTPASPATRPAPQRKS